ncbi:MAG TPA: GNAT family N-acetyltransferase [Ktedonobacterales bacterium]|nr:GNAT family N-acetyltransferase [Ktedonobacterales bacterium]
MADEHDEHDEHDEQEQPDSRREATLEVRPARPEDRDAVLAFCAHTWSDGDYIEYVWDDWLKEDSKGVLLVGLLDGQPVAINHVRMLSDDEAWLEGMRVDPAFRREGFGRIMTSRGLVAARERGASVARLITSSDNVASQGMIARFGFVRVAEMVRFRGPALAPSDDAMGIATPTRPGPDDFERIWEWLVQSNLAPLTGGLEYADWQARALTEPLLRGYLAAGQVRLIEEWGAIQALAVAVPTAPEWDRTPTLAVRYMDGLADAIGRLALSLRAEAAATAYARIEMWLPDLLILRDAMAGAGYEGDDEIMLVFAREL